MHPRCLQNSRMRGVLPSHEQGQRGTKIKSVGRYRKYLSVSQENNNGTKQYQKIYKSPPNHFTSTAKISPYPTQRNKKDTPTKNKPKVRNQVDIAAIPRRQNICVCI